MQKIRDIKEWKFLKIGETLPFPNVRGREVVIHFNAPYKSRLGIVQDGELYFLATVEGRDTVSFWIEGAFGLFVEGDKEEVGGVYFHSADGSTIHTENLSPVIFTKISERRRVSPEVMMMQRAMLENQRRMEAQMQDALDRRMAAFEQRSRENNATVAAPATAPTTQPATVAEPAAPVAPAPAPVAPAAEPAPSE